MQSSEDAHDRDVSGLHTVIRMDEEAKYYLTREIADLHRRLERKDSANRDLAQENDGLDWMVLDLNDEAKDLQLRINELNQVIGDMELCGY